MSGHPAAVRRSLRLPWSSWLFHGTYEEPRHWGGRRFQLLPPSESFPDPGHNSQMTSVFAEMRDLFPEGVHRFLFVALRGLYLAKLPRL